MASNVASPNFHMYVPSTGTMLNDTEKQWLQDQKFNVGNYSGPDTSDPDGVRQRILAQRQSEAMGNMYRAEDANVSQYRNWTNQQMAPRGLSPAMTQWLTDRGLEVPAPQSNVNMSQYWDPNLAPDAQWQTAVQGISQINPYSNTTSPLAWTGDVSGARPYISQEEYGKMGPGERNAFGHMIQSWDQGQISRQAQANRGNNWQGDLGQMDYAARDGALADPYTTGNHANTTADPRGLLGAPQQMRKELENKFNKMYPEYQKFFDQSGKQSQQFQAADTYNGVNLQQWISQLGVKYNDEVNNKYNNWFENEYRPKQYGMSLEDYNSKVRGQEMDYNKRVGAPFGNVGGLQTWANDEQKHFYANQYGEDYIPQMEQRWQEAYDYQQQQAQYSQSQPSASPPPATAPASMLGAPVFQMPDGQSSANSYNTALSQLMSNSYSSPTNTSSYQPNSSLANQMYNPYGYQMQGYNGGSLSSYFGGGNNQPPNPNSTNSFNLLG